MTGKEDILDRQPFIDKIISILEILSEEKRGTSFAIDGDWGSGKTFVLEQLEEQLEPVQSEETADDKYFLFHYNCWQYDYYDEPAVAIISAMLEKADSMCSPKAGKILTASWTMVKDKLVGIGNEFIKNRIGIDVVETINNFQEALDEQKLDNSSFDKWFSFKKTIDNTRKTICDIASEKTVIIIVDELDRCLPGYSIKVLERLHHIFDGIDNVVLIFAIDAKQLQHTVKSIFGNEDDRSVHRYLRKFINFELKLDYGSTQDNVWEKYQYYFKLFSDKHFPDDAYNVKKIVLKLFKYSKIDIRNQEKIIERTRTIHKLVCPENNADYSILLFELLVSIFSYVAPSTELKALPKINDATYVDLENNLGKELFDLLNELANSIPLAQNSENNINYYKNIPTLNNTYFYLYSLFTEETKCNAYSEYDDEIKICQKFIEITQLLT